MNPTATNAKGENSHSYPAYDYPVGIGTGLVAPKAGVITGLPGVPTRELMSPLKNGQAWPNAGGGSPNSGNVLVISHGGGEYTAYLHVTPYDVGAFRGRRVSQGEVFHKSGHNGWSTGPHLHFEVWKNGTRIDPGAWLANIKQGDNDMPEVLNRGDVFNFYMFFEGRTPTEEELNLYTGRTWKTVTEAFMSSQKVKERMNPNRPINKGDVINYLTDNLR